MIDSPNDVLIVEFSEESTPFSAAVPGDRIAGYLIALGSDPRSLR